MPRLRLQGWAALACVCACAFGTGASRVAAQEGEFAAGDKARQEPALPLAACLDRPLPITLPAALQLAQARPLDIAPASLRTRGAQAQAQRARIVWLPSIYLGVDYFRHDGQLQDIVGEVFGTSKGYFQVG